METLLIIAIIAGIIAGAVLLGLISWVIRSIKNLFAPKKKEAPKKVMMEEKAASDAIKEAELDVELDKRYREGCDLAIGDVTGRIENYEWKWLSYGSSSARYTSVEEFIHFEGDFKHNITEYEIRTLQNVEALRLKYAETKEHTVLVDVASGEEVNPQPVSLDARKEVIKTDDYGDIVRYDANQFLNFGSDNRMKAWLSYVESDDSDLPYIFVKEIHTCKSGFGNGAPSRYRMADDAGGDNEDVYAIFFDRVISVGTVSGSVWEQELKDYNELVRDLEHYNKYRHLLSWDEDLATWVTEPTPTAKPEKPMEGKIEEVEEEEAPLPKGFTEEEYENFLRFMEQAKKAATTPKEEEPKVEVVQPTVTKPKKKRIVRN